MGVEAVVQRPHEPKPPGWGDRYGAVFAEPEVVHAYRLRPPYPEETIRQLARLAAGGAVLDAGCGTAELARRLAPHVERVDAVDVSAPMLAEARRLAAGAPNVRFVLGRLEDAPLEPPYALAVAGDSVHWFDWPVALPRLAGVLGGDGLLALVHRDWLRDEDALALLRPVYERHSWNADFRPLDPVEELERRGHFRRLGEHVSAPETWRPTLDELVESHFSTSGLARPRLADPERFAAELREAVAASLVPSGGRYALEVVGSVVWGRPA